LTRIPDTPTPELIRWLQTEIEKAHKLEKIFLEALGNVLFPIILKKDDKH
jgi:hypothetical protein